MLKIRTYLRRYFKFREDFSVNKIIMAICLCFLTGCSATVQNRDDIFKQSQKIKQANAIKEEVVDLKKPLLLLPESEELVYKAKYLGITVGEMRTKIVGKTQLRGVEVTHFEMTATTNAFFSKFFKVNDRFVAYMDVKNHRVLRHEEYRHEGGYNKEAVVDFYYDEGIAHFRNAVDNTEKKVKIPKEGVFDILGANYYFRMVPWELGDTVEFKLYVEEKIYGFVGLVKSKTKVHVHKQGRKEAYKFLPYAFLNGDEVKDGSAIAFFSTEEYRIPLRGMVKTPIFGSASISLHETK